MRFSTGSSEADQGGRMYDVPVALTADAIGQARGVMEEADRAYGDAVDRGVTGRPLAILAAHVADSEAAYWRACEAYPAFSH